MKFCANCGAPLDNEDYAFCARCRESLQTNETIVINPIEQENNAQVQPDTTVLTGNVNVSPTPSYTPVPINNYQQNNFAPNNGKSDKGSNRAIVVLIVCIILALLAIGGLFLFKHLNGGSFAIEKTTTEESVENEDEDNEDEKETKKKSSADEDEAESEADPESETTAEKETVAERETTEETETASKEAVVSTERREETDGPTTYVVVTDGDPLRVRSGPGTSYSKKNYTLAKGTRVEVYGFVFNDDESTYKRWAEIHYRGEIVYVCADYLVLAD